MEWVQVEHWSSKIYKQSSAIQAGCRQNVIEEASEPQKRKDASGHQNRQEREAAIQEKELAEKIKQEEEEAEKVNKVPRRI